MRATAQERAASREEYRPKSKKKVSLRSSRPGQTARGKGARPPTNARANRRDGPIGAKKQEWRCTQRKKPTEKGTANPPKRRKQGTRGDQSGSNTKEAVGKYKHECQQRETVESVGKRQKGGKRREKTVPEKREADGADAGSRAAASRVGEGRCRGAKAEVRGGQAAMDAKSRRTCG